MRILVIRLRNLIWGSALFLGVVLVGAVLLTSDLLDISTSYEHTSKKVSIETSSEPADSLFASPKPRLMLDVTLEGSTANVKMITENFQFDPNQYIEGQKLEHGKGHAHLYLDGQLMGKLYEPEFLLKKLPKGEHELKVELTYGNDLPYKVEAINMLQVK